MKVVLVNPPSPCTFQKAGVIFPPLGLLYVAAAARQNGHEIEIVDKAVDGRKIDFSSYDAVGIHCDTTRYYTSMEIARRAKAAGARVVMGGPHPCFDTEKTLASGAVDVIVRGEGEISFPALLDAWEGESDTRSIPGLTLLSSGGPVETGPPEYIFNVDSLPLPARDLIDHSRYVGTRIGDRRLTSIHTSRGCPHGCRFCASSRIEGTRWRARSSESVLDEIENLVAKSGYRALAFVDDNFAGSPARTHEICDGILRKGLDVKWWCFCRADTITKHPEMIRHMAEAGAYSIFVGIETPSCGTLKHYKKGIDPDQAREAVAILKRNNLEIWASYILGAPEESRKDLRSTIRLAREMDTNIAQFTLLTPYPGTELCEELESRITEKDWSKYDALHLVFRHPTISRAEMHSWLVWAYLSYYTRHRRSISNFSRFLSNRRYGARLYSQWRTAKKG